MNEIKNDLVRESKLKDVLTEYYNYIIKAQIYFLIGSSSLLQLIRLLHIQDIVDVGMNISFFTMTISIMEFNDNIKASKNMRDKIDIKIKDLVNSFSELNTMAIEDFVQDIILKKGHISKKTNKND